MGKTYNKQVNTRIYYNIEVGVYAMKDIETVWALRGKAPQKSYDLSRTLTDIWRFVSYDERKGIDTTNVRNVLGMFREKWKDLCVWRELIKRMTGD